MRDWSRAGTNTAVRILPFAVHESVVGVVRGTVAAAVLGASADVSGRPNSAVPASKELVRADSGLYGKSRNKVR